MATIYFSGIAFSNRSSQAIHHRRRTVFVLVQPRREGLNTQLIGTISEVHGRDLRWLLLLAVMLAIGYVTHYLAEISAPNIHPPGRFHAGGDGLLHPGHGRKHAIALDERP